jgi:hypothetical protein
LHVVPPIEADNKTRIVSEGALPGMLLSARCSRHLKCSLAGDTQQF